MADEFIQQCRLDEICLFWDEWFLSEDDILGGCRVSGQESPVDVPTVAQVRIVTVLGGEGQDLLYELLCVGGPLKEQLHDGCQQLQLHLWTEKDSWNTISIIDKSKYIMVFATANGPNKVKEFSIYLN